MVRWHAQICLPSSQSSILEYIAVAKRIRNSIRNARLKLGLHGARSDLETERDQLTNGCAWTGEPAKLILENARMPV